MTIQISASLIGWPLAQEKLLSRVLACADPKQATVVITQMKIGQRPDVLIADLDDANGKIGCNAALKLWPTLKIFGVTSSNDVPVGVKKIERRIAYASIDMAMKALIEELASHEAESTLENFTQFSQHPVTNTPNTPNASIGSVLIIDDSATAREQLSTLLVSWSIDTDQAGSAIEAQRRLASKKYDLILLDIVMPGMDGYTFCRELRRKTELRKLPIIMVTSRSALYDRARGTLSGCTAYLAKPVQREKLKQIVDTYLLKTRVSAMNLPSRP